MSHPDTTHWLQIPFKDLEDLMKFVDACKADGVVGKDFGVRAGRQGDMTPHRTKKYVVAKADGPGNWLERVETQVSEIRIETKS